MPTSGDVSFRYRRRIADPMAALLADPFSELTRTRQTMLLSMTTITWLLFAGAVTITEAESHGLKIQNVTFANWLAFFLTAYLLIVYLLSVSADWAMAKAKRWSPLGSLEDAKHAMTTARDNRIRVNEARTGKMQSLADQMETITKERQPGIDEAAARYRAARVEQTSLTKKIGSLSPEERARLSAVLHETLELDRSVQALRQERDDKVSTLQHDFDEMMFDQSWEWAGPILAEQVDIDKMVSQVSRVTRQRLILEIMFPSAYAILALCGTLVWTLWR
jgi:hypothetical protein